MFAQQNYQILKKAAQFLQHIVPWTHYGSLSNFSHRRHMINLRSIEKLLVEAIYLIFFASKNGVVCSLRKKVLVTNGQNDEQQLKLIIITDSQKNKTEKWNQIGLQKSFICLSNLKEYQTMGTILDFIGMILGVYNECRTKGFILFNHFNSMIIKTQLEEFCLIYEKLIKPKAKQIKSVEVIVRAFQQTRLFRENSILLKYTNNSLLSKIITSPSCIKQIKKLALDFEKERLRFLRFPHDYVKAIDELIETFFKKLFEHKKIKLRISASQDLNEKQKQNVIIGSIVEKQNFENRYIKFEIKVQQTRYEFLSNQRLQKIIQNPSIELPYTVNKKKEKQQYFRIHEFEIEYRTVRNQLQIKLSTPQIVQNQELDIIGNIFNAYPNQSIKYSLCNQKRYNRQQGLYLVLHSQSRLHPKENPFYSILQQIDHLIIVQLLTQWDLKLKRVCSNKQKEILKQKFEYLSQKMREIMHEMLQQ